MSTTRNPVHVDEAILADLVAWGRKLQGFQPEHAWNALLVVQGYVQGVDAEGGRIPGAGTPDRDKLRLFAMDLTWTFWLDECFDGRAKDEASSPDVPAVTEAILGGEARTPEAAGFVELARRFEAYSGMGREYDLWRTSAADAVVAWGIEDRVSKGREAMSYAEYIENGVNSTAVPHIVATASLLHGFRLAARQGDDRVRRLVRNLSISCRLHNDLFSVDKERREGCLANAVLLLETILPGAPCHRLVADDLRGYERMIQADADALGRDDDFSRLAVIMPASHQVLYTAPRGHYTTIRETA